MPTPANPPATSRLETDAAALYIHIPYCLARCPYCDFNTYAARTWPERDYADALGAELAWHARQEPFRSTTVTSVFFGGGTPSLFAPATIARLLEVAAKHLRLSPQAEITLEANPGTVDRERLEGFRAAGVNRLSLGVQSFDDRFLRKLGRGHGVAESRAALGAAREAGFENFSLDLIYAVPSQSLEDLRADLEAAVACQPMHVSAYNLTYEPGTPMQRDLVEGRIQRAPEEIEIAMFETVRRFLAEAGLPAYEISNYARPGREARHNQAYWRGRPYLGLGAGAHSFTPGCGTREDDFGARWHNERDPNRYMERVRHAGQATAERETLDRRQALGEFCWLGLRETRGVTRDQFAARFAEPLDAVFPHVADLLGEGLLREGGGRLTLSRRGLLIADSVFATFF